VSEKQRRLVVPKGLKGPVGLDKQPVSTIQWVHRDMVHANNWNPNVVAPPELRLLKISLLSDGWTQPLVVYPEDENGQHGLWELVDGYHRWLITEDPRIAKMTDGHVPIAVIAPTSVTHRMMSTIRHNRARGEHAVRPMSDIVLFVVESGLDDHELALLLQMEPEEINRLRDRGLMVKRGAGDGYAQAWVSG
jgi:ParB-like chromosome segregation protein Spo0J